MPSLQEQLVSEINQLKKRITKLERQEKGFAGIGARVYNSANIAIPNNTTTTLTYDSERFDTDNIHSTSTNTGRLTCNTAGKYLIVSQVRWATVSGGRRQVLIRLDGSTIIAINETSPVADGTAIPMQTCATIYSLSVNSYVETRAFQTSGSDLNVTNNANYSPEFMMYLLP